MINLATPNKVRNTTPRITTPRIITHRIIMHIITTIAIIPSIIVLQFQSEKHFSHTGISIL